MKIHYKTPSEIATLKQGGAYHNELLLLIYDHAKAGVRLIELEKIAHDYLIAHKLKSAFKGYQGYPAQICLSVNNCLVHGIPDQYELKDGDVLKIDIGLTYQGMVTDAAIGKIIGGHSKNPSGAKLMRATKQALDESLALIKPGVSFMEYGRRVEQFIKSKGYSVVRSLTGHAVGKSVHEDPRVANYADHRLRNVYFKPGMVLALEPIIAEKSDNYITHPNKRNLLTKHGDLGAQREYTIVVTQTGYEVLAGVESV
ncbi:MAG TPA: type I methionyl aminopeptidase [Candidatus Absconditabacterales bacterium]|nr:type I methionyl aminopeptidase [Candidatus Absconditabacterales bacterium]